MPDTQGRRDSVPTKQLLGAILGKLGLATLTITEEDLAKVAGETVDITSERTDSGLRPGVYVIERTIPRPTIGIYRPHDAGANISPEIERALRRGPNL